jgi:uncharacterized protein (TIRG00374 family)
MDVMTTRHHAPKVKVGDEEDQRKGQARKGAAFIGIVLLAYVVYLVVTGQMGSFVDALGNVDGRWFSGAVVCCALYYVFGVLAYVIAVWLDPDSPVGIRDLMSVEASGLFFGNLTPLMAGSVPAQIFRLMRAGLDVGEATATQLTRFLMFQFAEVLFSALMLGLRFQFFVDTYGDILYLNLIVFCLHLVQLACFLVICLCPRFVTKVGNAGIRFLEKRGWFKKQLNYSELYEMTNTQVSEFSAAFRNAASHVPSMLLTCLVTMIQLGCLYSIGFFVMNAFGNHSIDYLSCLAAGSMVELLANAVPLPGGTGGAEGGFAFFFGPMLGGQAAAAFIVWRFPEFIMPTAISGLLLGLRSSHHESIRHRWDRVVHGRGRVARFVPRKAPKRIHVGR